jgi:putative glutathione S-transferase
MGLLVDGKWQDRWYDTDATQHRFVRSDAQFRHWVTRDGQPGPSGAGGFKAEPGRYHLYVSLACPWAHRTLILRRLKGLEPMISVSVLHWLMREQGWTFAAGPGVVPDPLVHAEFLHQVYVAADPPLFGPRHRAGPVHTGTIVSNESSKICGTTRASCTSRQA